MTSVSTISGSLARSGKEASISCWAISSSETATTSGFGADLLAAGSVFVAAIIKNKGGYFTP